MDELEAQNRELEDEAVENTQTKQKNKLTIIKTSEDNLMDLWDNIK